MSDMSSRNSSLSSTTPKSPFRTTKLSNDIGIGSNEYRRAVLESNNIVLEEATMTEEKWSKIAFSLGIPVRHSPRSNSDTKKLAHRMRKRKGLSALQTLEYIKPLINSVVTESAGISQQHQCLYHTDAVPTDEVLRNTVHRLPTPKPAISLGYCRDVFSLQHDELQNGIILGPNGEPRDLNHISQPVPDHFWPFFIIETSDKSMSAARQASAIAAATCSNALTILAGATTNVKDSPTLKASFTFDPKVTVTFSLSINGKEACLSSHGPQGSAPYVATTIATYKLDDEHDVASLADRMNSIMVWAQHARLAEIFYILDALERKVYGRLSRSSSGESANEFDPAFSRTPEIRPQRKPDRMRIALKASLPRWLGRQYVPQQHDYDEMVLCDSAW